MEKRDSLSLYVDGASKGNPGPASIGVEIRDAKEQILFVESARIGTTTNNVAEYLALLRGLIECLTLGASEVSLFSDSQLVVRQLKGEYRVRHPQIQPLFYLAQSLLKKFRSVTLTFVPREKNRAADRLANRAFLP